MGFRKWVYHKTEEAKIIDSDNLQEFLDDGWKVRPIATSKENAPKEEQKQTKTNTVETTQETKRDWFVEAAKLGKDALEVFAKEKFNIALDKRKNPKNMFKQLKKEVSKKNES